MLIWTFNRRRRGESRLNFKKVSRTLARLRDKHYPPTKKDQGDEGIRDSLKDPNIFEEYGKTLDKKFPLYIDSVINKKKNYAFHVFASLSTVKLIKKHIPPNQRRYLADGTFKITPKRFRKKGQVFVISIEYKNDVSWHTNAVLPHHGNFLKSILCSSIIKMLILNFKLFFFQNYCSEINTRWTFCQI